jgi:hypothetical protein
MGIISEYPIDATPQLADKAIGTSLTGPPNNTTVNFTFQSILDLFLPEITLQTVLDAGNLASEDINLDGDMTVSGYIYSENIRVHNNLIVENNINSDSINSQTITGNDVTSLEDIRANGVWIGSNGIATNTRVGFNSLISNTTGNNNVAFGYESLKTNSTGNGNTAIGYSSLSNVTTGSNNISVGFTTTLNAATNSNNILIGNNVVGGGDNSIVIGNGIIAAAANTVIIGNSAIVKTFLKGTINMANLPIISTGLVSGDLWRNGTVVNIIP